jgi:EAL domain-containing protein (putative c-di-GMP-specific phosphodiesterase class I)
LLRDRAIATYMNELTKPQFYTGTLPSQGMTFEDLYLRFPTGATTAKALQALEQSGNQVEKADDLVLVVSNVKPLVILRALSALLTGPERDETFALVKPVGSRLRDIDGLYAMPLQQLRNRLAAEWLVEMLHNNRLHMIFQPIVHAKNSDLVFGHEALVRGRLKDGEPVSPERMIEVAIGANLMAQFDRQAVELALTSAAQAKLEGVLFINCVPHHIYDPKAALAFAIGLCGKVGISPDRIVFEITEVEEINSNDARPLVRLFQNQGFRVALDDLGSGYSTLSTLSEIRPDFLKIDRSLISGINKDPYKALVLSSLLDSARVLGTPTIAEGIETQAEYDWACANDATYLQGNFVAPAREPSAEPSTV